MSTSFNSLLPLIDHLRESFSLQFSPLLGDTHRLDRLLDSGLMSLVLIINLRLCYLDQLLNFGDP